MVFRKLLLIVALLTSADVLAGRQFDISHVPTVKGVGLGSSKTATIKSLGMPQKVTADWNDGTIVGYGARTIYDYGGLSVIFQENQGCDSALTLVISRPQWVLSNGLKVGSMDSEIVKTLGEGKPQAEAGRKFERWYSFPTVGDYAELILVFDRKGGHVTEIRIDEDFD